MNWRTATLPDDALLVCLVRHGQTASNRGRKFVGVTDDPLDEVGQEQAKKLASSLGGAFRKVYTSPLRRAFATASGLGVPAVVDDLVELDQGELEGLTVRDGMARFPEFFAKWAIDPGAVTVPGGESMLDCRKRMRSVLRQIAEAHRGEGGPIAVVGHQLAFATILTELLEEPLSSWRKVAMKNTEVRPLLFADGAFRVFES